MLLSSKSISAARRAQSQQIGQGNPLSDFVDSLTTELGGGGGSVNYIFTPGAQQNGIIYGDWAQMMAAIAAQQAISVGFKPIIRFTASFTIPLAGMPVTGWGMALATLQSELLSTGSIVVTVPDGVILDMLEAVSSSLYLDLLPATVTPLTWSLFGTGGPPWVLSIGLGASCKNHGTIPAVQTPGGGPQTYFVLAFFADSDTSTPASTAPMVEAHGNDVVIYAGQNQGVAVGGSLDGWATTTSGGATLFYLLGISSVIPVITWAGSQTTGSIATDSGMLNQRSGTLAQRALLNPLLFGPGVGIGKTYFATDLGANGTPLWWTGALWVDATGAVVP